MVAGEEMPPREGGHDGTGAVEAQTISFVTIGRTSRRKHAVVVRFVFHEGVYFVMGAGGRSDWFANALASKSARLAVGGRAEAVAVEQFYDLDLVKELFAKKYGITTVKEWYSDPKIRSLRLTPVKADLASPSGEDLAERKRTLDPLADE